MSDWESAPSVVDDNTRKFLDFLGKAEGADYNTIVGGKSFNDFSAHPNVVGLRTKDGPSTAAGRYQILKSTYDDVAPKLGITDFSPESQDRIAIELIKRKGAFEDIQKGDYNAAIGKLGGTWASLPSSPYQQPKRSAQWVQKAIDTIITPAYAGEPKPTAPAPSADAGWETAPTKVATPAPAPDDWESAPSPAPVAGGSPKPADSGGITILPTSKESLKRDLSLGTRNVLEGVEQAVTYPVRAVADAASGALKLAGKAEIADFVARNWGTRGNAGRVVSDMAGLAKPQNRAEEIVASGTKAAAGLLPGTLVNTVAKEAPAVTQGVLSVLMPGTSGTAKEVAKDVAIYGGLGSAMDAAPAETAAGLAVLAAGKAGASKVLDSRAANKIIQKAGTDANAAIDAEIIKDLNKVAGGGNQRGVAVGTVQLNALENKYIGDVTTTLKSIGTTALEKMGLKASDITTAVRDRRIIGAEDLAKLRSTEAGTALADAIEKAQRARSLTAAVPAATNPLARVGRAALDIAPIPQPLRYVGQRILGSRQTREDVAQKLISERQARAAERVLDKVGPSDATKSLQSLQDLAESAKTSTAAKTQAGQLIREQAAQAAEAMRVRNLQLGVRSNPGFTPQDLKITGGVRGTLQYYGRLADSKELAKGLRIIEKTDPYMAPYIDQIKQNKLNTGNKEILLHLSDRLKLMRDQGVLKPYIKN